MGGMREGEDDVYRVDGPVDNPIDENKLELIERKLYVSSIIEMR